MKITFIDNAKLWYKMYSVWFMALLGMLPDIFNLAITSGLFSAENAPEKLSYLMKVVAFLGIVSRLIKQKVAETPPPSGS